MDVDGSGQEWTLGSGAKARVFYRLSAGADALRLQSCPLRRRRLTMLNLRLQPGDRRTPKLVPCKGTTEDRRITADYHRFDRFAAAALKKRVPMSYLKIT